MNAVDPQDVTWVHVEQPVFDLLGVLTSSLTFAVGLLALALVLGSLLGWLRIRRRRNRPEEEPLLAGLHHGVPPPATPH